MVVAFAEACSWIGLLIGMYGKYIGDAGEHGVEVFGRIHGIVVLAYVAVALLDRTPPAVGRAHRRSWPCWRRSHPSPRWCSSAGRRARAASMPGWPARH